MSQDFSSQSLFTPSSAKDVRHDIGTVQEKWSHEQNRRRKRALIAVIIGVLVVVPSFFALAYYVDFFPGHQIFEKSPEETEEDSEKNGDFGYPDAKVQIVIFPKLTIESHMEVLHEAVDSKPSEIFVHVMDPYDIRPDDRMKKESERSCGFTINGKNKFQVILPDEKGVNKVTVVNLDSPYGEAYSEAALKAILTQVHAEQYGATAPGFPLFQTDPNAPKPPENKEVNMDDPLLKQPTIFDENEDHTQPVPDFQLHDVEQIPGK